MNAASKAHEKPKYTIRPVKDSVFKRYTRLKYLLRIKHWHGRDVHSPFTYNLVREALMLSNRNRNMPMDAQLKESLEALGMPSSRINRICRVYNHLNYSSFAVGLSEYNGEDMLIVPERLSKEQFDELAGRIKESDKQVCVVLLSIYASTDNHSAWHYIMRNHNAVFIDLYHIALIVFDKYLSKQSYKMRF